MLSRRQAWRRRTQVIHRQEHDFIYKEELCQDLFKNRSASDPTLNSIGKSDFAVSEKTWGSTGNLVDKNKPMCYIPYVPNIPPPSSAETKNSKKVRFNLGVRVVLIPTRIEYRDIGLTDLIWWNENDYCIFRNGAAEELEIAVEYFQVDSKEAIKLLYQPEFDNMCRFLEQSPRLERLPSNRGLQDSMSVDSIPNFSPIPMKAPLIQLPLVVPVQVGSHNRET